MRFEYVDRIVTSYYVDENAPTIGWWREEDQARSPGVAQPIRDREDEACESATGQILSARGRDYPVDRYYAPLSLV